MASITKDKRGRFAVQFILPDKKRGTIRLDDATEKQAKSIKGKIEDLLCSLKLCEPAKDETRVWVSKLWNNSEDLAEKLAGFGLIERRGSRLLGEFLDEYLAQHAAKQKPGTIIALDQARQKLIAHFGAERPLRSIGLKEADDWENYLRSDKAPHARKPGKPERGARGLKRKAAQVDATAKEPKKLAEQTIRRRLGMAKQFFKAALRYNLIELNPFADKVSRVSGNESRKRFIDLEACERVVEALPDVQWRTIFALARHGGLRTPSEVFALKWNDVFWDNDDARIVVTSSKTEHHAGHDRRTVPMFARLRPFLEAAWSEAEPGAVYVIDPERFKAKNRNANLRTQFCRFMELAGIEMWPKVFQNLRASRVTEAVREGMVPKAVEKYFGHSWEVSMENYQTIDESDRRKWSTASAGTDTKPGALQNALHSGALPSVVECHESGQVVDNAHVKTLGDTRRHLAQLALVGPPGLLKSDKPSAIAVVSLSSAAKSAARQPAGGAVCQTGSDEARAELTALAGDLPPQALGELLAVARAMAADAARAGAEESGKQLNRPRYTEQPGPAERSP